MKKLSLSILLSFSFSVFASGSRGSDGWSGDSKIITAGTPMSLNLSGSDGGKGGDGSDGDRGNCGSHTNDAGETVNDDVAGKDGEDGGDGGSGGAGGDLTVLFSDYADLQKIRFVSYGGDGGEGGEGGDGGSGCPNGDDGSDGSRGSSGYAGDLYLVPKAFWPYERDNSNGYISVEKLIAGQKLVKQNWTKIDGRNVMAANSYFSYARELKGYQYGSAKIEILDPTMVDPRLFKETMTVKMENQIAKIDPGYSFYVVARHSDPDADAVLQIERMYSRWEFQSIKYKNVNGTVGDRKIFLATSADLLPHPTLSMDLKVEVKKNIFSYKEIYKATVPAEFIRAVESGYEIDLDKLPLSQKIKKGAKIRLSMKYKLQEMTISHANEEIWVLNAN